MTSADRQHFLIMTSQKDCFLHYPTLQYALHTAILYPTPTAGSMEKIQMKYFLTSILFSELKSKKYNSELIGGGPSLN